MKQLALFPLNSFILPEGRMRLRIFEPRYVRLVSEASAGKRDFALAQINPYVSQHHPDRILPLATRVQIEDFEQLDDGLLGITIAGVEKVQIIRRWQEADQLHVAEVSTVDNWPQQPLLAEYQPLIMQLQKLMQQYPANTLFHGIGCGDLVWDKFEFFKDYKEAIAMTGVPFYNVIGKDFG